MIPHFRAYPIVTFELSGTDRRESEMAKGTEGMGACLSGVFVVPNVTVMS